MKTLQPYRPEVEHSEQRFGANLVTDAEKDGLRVLRFSDVLAPDAGPLERGTPLHALVFELSAEGSTVELNDRGKRSAARDVSRIEVPEPGVLRVVFKPGRGPYSGRVPLAKSRERFSDAGWKRERLSAVKVHFFPRGTKPKKFLRWLVEGGFEVVRRSRK